MLRNVRHILLAAVTAAAVIMAIFSALGSASAQEEPPSELSSVEENSEGYYVTDCNGYVGIYYGTDENSPAVITEIPIDSLRIHDRELVRQGYVVESRDRLMQMLEDIGS